MKRNVRYTRITGFAAIAAALIAAAPMSARAATPDEAGQFFQTNCISCHTIGGGRLTGPDLKDATKRKDAAWISNFMQNPKAVIDSGDQYAAALAKDANGVVMPTVAGMTPDMAAGLIALIEAESKLPKSRFAGSVVSDAPYTTADIDRGRRVFMGVTKLKNGGPACVSCHTAGIIAPLGGGKLGPDLTKVYERLKGRKGLSAWLLAPGTPTMKPLFAKTALEPDEINSLTAFFEYKTKQGAMSGGTGTLNFLLLGLGGAAVCLAVTDLAWRRRLRSVRRTLVEGPCAGSDNE